MSSRTWKTAAFALAALLLSAGLAQAGTLVVDEGYNFLKTTPRSYTTVSIPQGFFGDKNGVPSDPIVNRVVELEGRPIGSLGLSPRSGVIVAAGNCHSKGGHEHCHAPSPLNADIDTITTIGGASIAKVGDTAEVTLQIVALSLQTPEKAPVEVTYGGKDPSYFRALVALDPSQSQPIGSIRLHRTKDDGGIMEVEMPVKFQVLFTGGRAERFGPVSLSTVLESDDNGFTVEAQ